MIVTGIIIRRRSLGQYLAFADIKRVDVNDDYDDDDDTKETIKSSNDTQNKTNESIVKIAFRRSSDSWNKEFDFTFPTKASHLPYGAQVQVQVQVQTKVNDHIKSNLSDEKKKTWEVHKWKILVDPRKIATQVATYHDSHGWKDGISCSTYLKVRGDAYFQYHENKESKSKNEIRLCSFIQNDTTNMTVTKQIQNQIQNQNQNPIQDLTHGDKRAKSLRAKIFAKWLIDTYGITYLQGRNNQFNDIHMNSKYPIQVLDIAGGKGQLSIELSVVGQIPSTIIDPLIRKRGKQLIPKQMKRIQKVNGPIPNFISKAFQNNIHNSMNEMEQLIKHATCLVGLHPDQCTEDILDVALQYNKPVAIVPCCVFPTLFPMRRLCGKHENIESNRVTTYDDFIQYLLQKDDRLREEILPFEGKNKVIYLPLSSNS